MDPSASVEIAKHALMSGGLVLAVGSLAGLFARKTKIPDVAVFLLAGMLIGPQALGLVDIKADSALYQIILLFGASYILFDGGASLRLAVLKQVWITIVVIATIGVQGMNRVWQGRQNLPTLEEIRDPGRWIERVAA